MNLYERELIRVPLDDILHCAASDFSKRTFYFYRVLRDFVDALAS